LANSTAVVRSPEPVKVRSISGVVTCQVSVAFCAIIRIPELSASSPTTEVTSTVCGPRARSAAVASTTSAMVEVVRSVRYSSSNRLGVMMVAWLTTWSRMNSGMPGAA